MAPRLGLRGCEPQGVVAADADQVTADPDLREVPQPQGTRRQQGDDEAVAIAACRAPWCPVRIRLRLPHGPQAECEQLAYRHQPGPLAPRRNRPPLQPCHQAREPCPVRVRRGGTAEAAEVVDVHHDRRAADLRLEVLDVAGHLHRRHPVGRRRVRVQAPGPLQPSQPLPSAGPDDGAGRRRPARPGAAGLQHIPGFEQGVPDLPIRFRPLRPEAATRRIPAGVEHRNGLLTAGHRSSSGWHCRAG